MSARGLSTTRWRRTWRDRLPPRREWPAMVACYLLVAVPAAVGAGYVIAEWLVAP